MTNVRTGAGIAVLAGLLAACASPEQASQSAGMQNSCINPTEIRKQTIVSDQEIRFEMRNGEVWANTLPRSCPNLKFQQAFSWDVRGTLVCSNQQTIYVKDDGTPCQLGEFARLPAEAAKGS